MEFTLKERAIVKPSSPTPLGSLVPLGTLDKVVPPMYLGFLFLYPPTDIPILSEELKNSLSKTLVIFPVFAGRYMYSPDKKAWGVDCCDAGAEFYEAHSNLDVEDLSGFPQRLEPDVTEQLSPFKMIMDPECDMTKLPLLLVQLTRFKKGSCTLVVATHHNVCDGHSVSLFVRAWAQARLGIQHVIQMPCFDRELIKPRCASGGKYSLRISPVTPQFHNVRAQLVRFTKDDIKTLKNGEETTSFEAVVAYIWRCILKARNSDPLHKTSVAFSIDGRARFNPEIPVNYFGNVVLNAKATCSVQELVGNPLGFAIGLVQDAKRQVDDEYLRDTVDSLEEHLHSTPPFLSAMDPKYDLQVTSWMRFPLYEADLGWGKPVFAGAPLCAPGCAIFLPLDGSGNVDVLTSEEELYYSPRGLLDLSE